MPFKMKQTGVIDLWKALLERTASKWISQVLAQAIRRIELLFTEMEEVCGKSRFGGKSDSTSWEIIISS